MAVIEMYDAGSSEYKSNESKSYSTASSQGCCGRGCFDCVKFKKRRGVY